MSNKRTSDLAVIQERASHVAEQLFGNNMKKRARFSRRLIDIYSKTEDKDFLLIHNPGGWGGTPLEYCQQWERSIMQGISTTLDKLGYTWQTTQYLRSGWNWWSHLFEMKEHLRFFFKGTSTQAKILAAEVQFTSRHLGDLKVILIGASQGAAFSNAVMRQLGGLRQVYSIELGIFFPHMSRRIVTERTLAIDSNGIMPDPVAHRNLKAETKAYLIATFLWTKYCLLLRPKKFTHCVNFPGHDYSWEYPEVQRQIKDFLNRNFGNKNNVEVDAT